MDNTQGKSGLRDSIDGAPADALRKRVSTAHQVEAVRKAMDNASKTIAKQTVATNLVSLPPGSATRDALEHVGETVLQPKKPGDRAVNAVTKAAISAAATGPTNPADRLVPAAKAVNDVQKAHLKDLQNDVDVDAKKKPPAPLPVKTTTVAEKAPPASRGLALLDPTTPSLSLISTEEKQKKQQKRFDAMINRTNVAAILNSDRDDSSDDKEMEVLKPSEELRDTLANINEELIKKKLADNKTDALRREASVYLRTPPSITTTPPMTPMNSFVARKTPDAGSIGFDDIPTDYEDDEFIEIVEDPDLLQVRSARRHRKKHTTRTKAVASTSHDDDDILDSSLASQALISQLGEAKRATQKKENKCLSSCLSGLGFFFGMLCCSCGCCWLSCLPDSIREYGYRFWRAQCPFTIFFRLAPTFLLLCGLTIASLWEYARLIDQHPFYSSPPVTNSTIPMSTPMVSNSTVITEDSIEWRSTPTWRWLALVTILFAGIVCSHMVVGFVRACLRVLGRRHYWSTRILYYFDTITYTFATFCWCLLCGPLADIIVPYLKLFQFDASPEDVDVAWYLFRFWLAIVIVSGCRCITLVFTRVAIVSLQRQLLWQRIFDYLTREKILQILLRPPIRTHAEPEVSYKHYLSQITNLPTLIGRVNPFHAAKDVFDEQPTPSPDQFVQAWTNILTKQVLGVLPQKAEGTGNNTFHQAAATADEIFRNVAGDDRDSFMFDDVARFFDETADAEKAFSILNGVNATQQGVVKKGDVVNVVYETFKDRKAIYRTLSSRESLAGLLNRVIAAMYWLAMVVVVAVVFGLQLIDFFVPIGTTLLAMTFVFGSSAKRMWENLVTIFVVRPFDVGGSFHWLPFAQNATDRITISGYPTLIVHSIHLMTTDCWGTDGKAYIVPNEQFSTAIITQYKRSRDFAVEMTFILDAHTSSEKLAQLEALIRQWMRQDQANTPWAVDGMLLWVGSCNEELNVMKFELFVELKGINWQSPGLYLVPRSKLWLYAQTALRELGISHRRPVLPILIGGEREETDLFSAESDKKSV